MNLEFVGGECDGIKEDLEFEPTIGHRHVFKTVRGYDLVYVFDGSVFKFSEYATESEWL